MLYIQYETYKSKYYKAQQNFDAILSEQERLFSKTQQLTANYCKEPVNGGKYENPFDSYVVLKDKRQVDQRLQEVKSILENRGKLLILKEKELRQSDDIRDKVYTARYIDNIKVKHLPSKLYCSERQVYRILKEIRKEINKLGSKCQ